MAQGVILLAVVFIAVLKTTQGAAPVFSSGTYTVSVNENSGIGTELSLSPACAASDGDSDVISYSLSGTGSSKFTVGDSGTGGVNCHVYVNAALDYDSGDTSFLLTITATANAETDTASLTITVTDLDDEPPTCSPSIRYVDIDENTAASTLVASLSTDCSDSDTAAGKQIQTYAINSGDDASAKFSIANSGDISTTATALDYETKSLYKLVVDVADTAQTSTTTVFVTVGNLNDNTPAWSSGGTTPTDVSIPETAAVGYSVFTVSADDADLDNAGSVSYSLTSAVASDGATSGLSLFDIDSDGYIRTSGTLDRDAGITYYVLTVKAYDAGSPVRSVTGTMTVTLTAVNEFTPTFSQILHYASVSEGAAAGTSIYTIPAATDGDSDSITYSFVSDLGKFQFDGTNVRLIEVQTAIDLDTGTSDPASYTLEVEAADSSRTSTATVYITVTSTNDHDPVFGGSTPSTTVTVDEDTAVGDLVATVTATDDDYGEEGDVAYSMPTHAKFSLDTITGEIKVKAELDTLTSYSVTVTATDQGVSPRTDTVTITLSVGDVNDNAPTCSPRTYTKSYREDFDYVNDAATDPVATLSCTDADSSPNDIATYAITTVNGVASATPFSVSSAGVITVISGFNYETRSFYSILVTVTDGGTPALSTTANIYVSITDVNEGTPTFTSQPTTGSVAESAAVGTSVTRVTATDADTDNTLTYTLSASSSVFHVDPTSGIVYVKSALDYETTTSYTLDIVATDDGTVDAVKSATHSTLTISVTNVNDVTPTFSPASYFVSVDENEAVGTTVTTVTATDDGSITYSITSGDTTPTSFRMTGADVIIDNSLDYETTPAYELTVEASDGTNTGTTTVVISVNNINENTPTYSSGGGPYTVSEDQTLDTTVGTVVFTDSDDDAAGDIVYSIFSGNTNSRFSIDPTTGVLKLVQSLDMESTTSYNLVIHAVDQGSTQRTGSVTVTVNVGDVNDETPTCSAVTQVVSLSEVTTSSTTVATVSCPDSDASSPNSDVTYSITAGNTAGYFAMASTTGVITTSSTVAFDYESATKLYTLVVKALDGGTPARSSSATVYVSITGSNEHTPTFTTTPMSVSIAESASVGSSVADMVATDADQGNDGVFTYSIASGNTGSKFQIDSSTGRVNVLNTLDRESVASYSLTIRAIDKGTTARTGVGTLNVAITDVNDNTPSCSAELYTTTLNENTVASTSLGVTLGCSDADATSTSNVITYSISSGNTNSAFAIGSSSGDITVNSQAALDIETSPSFQLVVKAIDGGSPALTATMTVVVNLVDVNEHTPAFSGAPYSVTVSESAAVGDTVTNIITASDSDVGQNGVITYSINSGNTAGKFAIDANTGLLFLRGTLDYETTTSYTLSIKAADGNGTPLTSLATITVTLQDANDETPTCTPNPRSVSVAEDEVAGYSVLTLACSDADTAVVNTQLTYSINSGNGGSLFLLDSSTGELTLQASLDYETATVHELVIHVADAGTPSLTGTTYVTVNVAGVNEHTPTVTGNSHSVLESAALGTVVATVAGSDTDNGIHGTLRWSITNGNSEGKFNIDESTGNIVVVSELDRETTASYNLEVTATDSLAANSDELSSSATIVVTVSDVNDNSPVYAPTAYAAAIGEDAATGDSVVQLTASDADAGANAVIAYSIVTGDTTKFALSGSELQVAGALDADTTDQYVLTIRATDSTYSATATVVVTVTYVNDFTPSLDTTTTSVSTNENVAIATSLHQFSASDSDAGSDGVISYVITAGNTDNAFVIDSDTGELYVSTQLDYDTTPTSYSLTVEARDRQGGTGYLSDSMTFTVNINDLNDNAPAFSSSTYTASVNEDAADATTVATVAATDADSGVNDDVTFTLIGGDSGSQFTVDSSTGEILTAAGHTIDHESKTSYVLLIRASDGGTPSLSSQCSVMITVNDVNDNIPVFEVADFSTSVTENQAASVSVTTVQATDADSATFDPIVYSIASGDLGHFAIDASTGEITTTSSLDRETYSSYTLIIHGIDNNGAGQTGSGTVTVNVEDENDETPYATNTPYDVTIAEDTHVAKSIMTITSSDDDAGQNAEVTYVIVGGNSGTSFKIDTYTGVLTTATYLDRETYEVYELVIDIVDKGSPSLTGTVTATLTISDINDNEPIFTSSFYNFYVDENSVFGTTVGRVTANDADKGSNAIIQYSIVETTVGVPNHFYILASSGYIAVKSESLDRETNDTYVMRVRARDLGTPQHHSDASVTIFLNDLNDIVPLFSQTSYSASVYENVNIGTSVTTVTAMDIDLLLNKKLNYTLEGASGSVALFDIDSITGKISTAGDIDREANRKHTLTVRVTDGGTPPLTDTSTLIISISDINDNAPLFTKTVFTADIAFDDYTDGSTILTVSANDADTGINAKLNYDTVDTNEFFAVDDSGKLSRKSGVSLSVHQEYTVSVKAMDGGSTPLTGMATVEITTFPPSITLASITMAISQAVFEGKKADFTSKLEAIMKDKYSSIDVHVYNVSTVNTTSSVSSRRRLLQTSGDTILVTLYATNGTGSSREFLTDTQLMEYLVDQDTAALSTYLQGAQFAEYNIVAAEDYIANEETVPWWRSTTGLVVIVTSSSIGFLIILILIIVLSICYCNKRPVKVINVRPRNEISEAINVDKKKLLTKPSVIPMTTRPMAEKQPTTTAVGPVSQNKVYHRPSDISTARALTPTEEPAPSRPRMSQGGAVQDDAPSGVNRYYDGKAYDPVTGRMYEYNTETNERRWLTF